VHQRPGTRISRRTEAAPCFAQEVSHTRRTDACSQRAAAFLHDFVICFQEHLWMHVVVIQVFSGTHASPAARAMYRSRELTLAQAVKRLYSKDDKPPPQWRYQVLLLGLCYMEALQR